MAEEKSGQPDDYRDNGYRGEHDHNRHAIDRHIIEKPAPRQHPTPRHPEPDRHSGRVGTPMDATQNPNQHRADHPPRDR